MGLYEDWGSMFGSNPAALQNTGDTMNWAGGTLTRDASGALTYNPGAGGQVTTFNQSTNPLDLASKYGSVAQQWTNQYGGLPQTPAATQAASPLAQIQQQVTPAAGSLANDWSSMFGSNAAAIKNAGDTMNWAGGTLLRNKDGSLLYDPGQHGVTTTINASMNPAELAKRYMQVRQLWADQYGTGLDPDYAGGQGAAARDALNHISGYGLNAQFTKENPYEVSGAGQLRGIKAYNDPSGNVMFDWGTGQGTFQDLAKSNMYKALTNVDTATPRRSSTVYTGGVNTSSGSQGSSGATGGRSSSVGATGGLSYSSGTGRGSNGGLYQLRHSVSPIRTKYGKYSGNI